MPKEQETLVSIKFLLHFTVDRFIDVLAGLIENCSPVSQDMNHISWSSVICPRDFQT
jgi:hypothetical protein